MKGKNINLRAVELTDLDLLYKWENDQDLWYLGNTLTPFSRFVIEQYILSAQQDIFTNKQLRLMIDLNSSKFKVQSSKSSPNTGYRTPHPKITIGSIDLFDFEPANKRAGIGILIDNDYRNKGYATEALELLIDYSFKVLNLHQLYCNITSDNAASLKLFQKLNFKIVGIKKHWILVNNIWKDEYMLQLINKDTSIKTIK